MELHGAEVIEIAVLGLSDAGPSDRSRHRWVNFGHLTVTTENYRSHNLPPTEVIAREA